MKELISLHHINAQVEVSNWQEAIQAVGQLLLDSNNITSEYIESMIQSVLDFGPYIVLMPRFALAHAAPSEAVLKTGISLITLKNPVNFESDNDPVQVILCLACTDQKSHLELLSQLAQKLMLEDSIKQLSKCQLKEKSTL